MDKTAMIHLYRGELGRMTAYRIRLDTTSNWALGASVAVVTFALGHPAAPHAVLALPLALTFVFALLEARRLQDLELLRERVRLLESGFFSSELGEEPLEDWQHRLAASLRRPVSNITLVQALATRIRRNYIWLFLVLYASWWLKLWTTPGDMLDVAALGPLPGWLTITLSTCLLVPLFALTAMAKPLLRG